MAKKLKPLTTDGLAAIAEAGQAGQARIEEASQASKAMIALFAEPKAIAPEKLVRRNLPQMIKPGEVPLGAVVSGEILKIVPSPVTTIKGLLLWLRHESGREFLFPCTGVIRSALAPGKTEKEVEPALQKEVGNQFYAKRLENKPSKYKKEMFVFDVFTSKG